MSAIAVLADKRWEHGRERWARPGATIDARELGVELIEGRRQARAFIEAHHYSGSFPAARASIGLFRKTGVDRAHLAGVAVFSVPMQRAVVPRYTGLESDAGVELGRFVCLPEIAYNGESWFLSRAFRCLLEAKPGIRAVVSYADPLERRGDAGELTKAAHWGTIYQASNAHFAGRAKAETLIIDRTGRVVSRRGLSKIRNGERGAEGEICRLETRGADSRRPLEDPASWLERVLVPPAFFRLRHPGNFCYVFGLDPAARASILAANGPGLPYPKPAAAA